MRIKMKETRRGTEDGFTVKEYKVGKEYDLEPTPRGEELGQVFIREGWAEEVKAPAAAPPKTPPAPPSASSGLTTPSAAPPAMESAPAQAKGTRRGQ